MYLLRRNSYVEIKNVKIITVDNSVVKQKKNRIDMKNKEYWKFILSKAFRTGLQSAISLYLANSSGIIDANMIELIGVAFMSSALSVIQNGLEQAKPKYTFEDKEVAQKPEDW